MAAPTKVFNVKRAKRFPNSDKTVWRKVGRMVEFEDGTRKLELFHLDGEFHVFEDNDEERFGGSNVDQAISQHNAQVQGRRKR